MSLESLFLKEVNDKGDLALTQLPKDMDQWAETIVGQVKEKLPQGKNLLMKVTFLQKNEESGTATGCVTLHDQKLNKSIYIPLIAKNFKLYPLDVMICPKKNEENGMEVMPLTKELFDECMFNNDVFDHLERPMDRIQQLYLNPQNSVVYPPYFRNVYASGNMIDAINDTISPEDRKAFIQQLKDNPQILVGYEKRANLDILQKIANQNASMANKNQKEVHPSKLNSNITLIKKDVGSGDYKVCYTSDEVFDPLVETVKDHEIRKELSQITNEVDETLNEVHRNGEYIVVDKTKPAEGASVKDMDKRRHQDVDGDPVEAKTFGSYRVMDKMGVQHKGLVFPVVINFDQKVTGAKLFYKGDKTCYQTKIVGIPTMAEPKQFLRLREPVVGMTGVFVTMNEKNAVATIPMTIKSLYEDCGYLKMVGEDMNGRKVKVKYSTSQGLSSIEENLKKDFDEPSDLGLKEIAKVKDFYIVPRRFKFLPLSNNFCELHENPGTMYMKTASAKADASPVKVIYTGANQFSLKGPDMEKMAYSMGWDKTNLSAGQAIFLLSAKKCPLSKTAQALKSAGTYGSSEIHHLPVVISADQYKASLNKTASYMDTYIRGLKVNLIKEAAKLDESHLVDTALSLNFINSKNLDKFISFIPYLKECSKMLAQALLASRIGMQEIPEQDTQTAMYKIVDVIRGLERLKQHKSS